MTRIRGILRALLLAILVPLATPVRAETPAPPKAPSDAEVRQLEQQLEALTKQVENLEASTNEDVRQTLMQLHWVAMQDYMGWVHRRFGAGAPWMMDPDAQGGPGASACPMLGGSGAAWPLPEGVGPRQYGQQMRVHMQALNEQMGRIAQASDPTERQRLLQEHWQSMYRDMQSMRGLGWMWGAGMMGGAPSPGGGEAKPLPDPDSAGAKLVSSYCVQCHVTPSPALLTSAEWGRVVNRMHMRIEGRVTATKTPSQEELRTILAYMEQHAR